MGTHGIRQVEVVHAARAHLGTPWVHQGRLAGSALDCAGLVIVAARELGLVPPEFDVNGYGRVPDGTMLEWCRRFMQPLPSPELGAVAAIVVQRVPQHLGIVGDYVHGGFSLIHAASDAGRVVEHRLAWRTNLRGVACFRLPGVAAPVRQAEVA